MRFLVVGAGATGGFFGARLSQAGRDVTFLVRAHRAGQLRERGLRVRSGESEETVRPAVVLAADLAPSYDVILLSVRTTALNAALADIAPAVGDRTVIVPFLNGVGHLDVMTARFGTAHVLGGVAKVAAMLDDDGDIFLVVPQASLTVGELSGGLSDRVTELAHQLSGAGFSVEASADIVTAMWSKWAFITTVGGMTTLMRSTVGDIVAVPGGDLLGPGLLAETTAICVAAGHPLPDADVAAVRATVTQPGSPLNASMARDLQAGRTVEVEPVFGDLIARARTLGVAAPLLDLVTLNLRVYEHRRAAGDRTIGGDPAGN
jgi:2-dehydropantoate 2-reductase